MSILLTGATGFTGSFVLELLREAGMPVRCVIRSPEKAEALRATGADVRLCDLADSAAIEEAARGCDVFLNIASLGFGHAPSIVRAVEAAGVQRAVYISTTSIFTQLNAPSKTVRVAAENTIRHSSTAWTILRPTMIYGTDRDRNMCRLIRYVSRFSLLPVFGPGTFLMQPIYVRDLAAAIIRAAQAPAAERREYNVAGRDALSYKEVVQTVASLMRRRIRLWHLPVRPLVSVLRAAERCRVRLPIKSEQILRLNESKAFSYEEARRDFGFAPRSFAEGISLELQQMKLRGEEGHS